MAAARVDPLEVFGHRVRERRLKNGMSQEQLGFTSGLHPTYISRIERGVRNIGLRNLLAVANALEIDPAMLVKGLSN